MPDTTPFSTTDQNAEHIVIRIMQAEIGKDIANLRSEMLTEHGKLRYEIASVKGEIKDASLSTLKWCIATMLTCTGIIVGALFAK